MHPASTPGGIDPARHSESDPGFAGETEAMLEVFDLTRHSVRRFPTDPWISYVEL